MQAGYHGFGSVWFHTLQRTQFPRTPAHRFSRKFMMRHSSCLYHLFLVLRTMANIYRVHFLCLALDWVPFINSLIHCSAVAQEGSAFVIPMGQHTETQRGPVSCPGLPLDATPMLISFQSPSPLQSRVMPPPLPQSITNLSWFQQFHHRLDSPLPQAHIHPKS